MSLFADREQSADGSYGPLDFDISTYAKDPENYIIRTQDGVAMKLKKKMTNKIFGYTMWVLAISFLSHQNLKIHYEIPEIRSNIIHFSICFFRNNSKNLQFRFRLWDYLGEIVHEDVEDLIRSMLNVDPSQRATVEDVEEKIENHI